MALLLLVFAVVVLGGVFLMLVAAGNELDRRLDREVDRVERNLDDQFNEVQRDVRSELDRRLPEETAAP
jgi:sensor domain CHASE-containing protein